MKASPTSEEPLPEPLEDFRNPDSKARKVLDRVDALWKHYEQAKTEEKILPNVVEAVRVELTYHSNAIEGSTLTLRETQLVIEGQTPGSSKPLREIFEARNHDRAVRLIELWNKEKTAPLTEKSLLDLHAVVLHDIAPPGEAGVFRTERVLIAGSRHVPPGSHRLPVLISKMFGLAVRDDVHPVLRAAELHYHLAAIHPFRDGNGRTARLMMNALLLQSGYPLCIVDVAKRPEYLDALSAANTGETDRFALFVVESVEQSLLMLLGND